MSEYSEIELKIISKIGEPAFFAMLGAFFFFMAYGFFMVGIMGELYLYSTYYLLIPFENSVALDIAQLGAVPFGFYTVFKSFYQKPKIN
jgi:hypothetical protein